MNVSRDDEARADSFLRSLDLVAARYSHQERSRFGKTPDFKVRSSRGAFRCVCEVKSVLTKTGPSGILHSTIYNSVSENIHDAYKQFVAVNPWATVPNVLVWRSHNMQINEDTFLDLMKGKIQIEELDIADLKKYRWGQIAYEVTDIDLHVWLYADETASYVLTNSRYVDQLREAFRIPEPTVVKVHLEMRSFGDLVWRTVESGLGDVRRHIARWLSY